MLALFLDDRDAKWTSYESALSFGRYISQYSSLHYESWREAELGDAGHARLRIARLSASRNSGGYILHPSGQHRHTNTRVEEWDAEEIAKGQRQMWIGMRWA